MKLNTRWLDWQPEAEKFGKSLDPEPAKTAKMISAVFAGALSTQNQNFLPPEAPLRAYEDGFDRWAASRCVFRDRAWGGIGALHANYASWCDREGREVPASRQTFERILLRQGLWSAADLRDGLVYGLLLKEDWEARPEALDVLDALSDKRQPQERPRRRLPSFLKKSKAAPSHPGLPSGMGGR